MDTEKVVTSLGVEISNTGEGENSIQGHLRKKEKDRQFSSYQCWK